MEVLDQLPGDDGGGGGGGGGGAPTNPSSGDWARIAGFTAGRTEYKPANFAALNPLGAASLNGTYTVLAVASDHITLSNPEIVNPNWSNIAVATAYISASLSTSGERWIGPFTISLGDLDRVLVNLTAEAGLYGTDKKNKYYTVSVTAVLELTPVDGDDEPIGPPEQFYVTLSGEHTGTYSALGGFIHSVANDSQDFKDAVRVSMEAIPSFRGRCKARMRRISPTNHNPEGTLVDEIKWRDGYGQAAVEINDFGNVTTVMARTYATSGAASVKSRKLNLDARRRLPARVAGNEFTGDLHGTDSIDDIISAICLDPFLGNRRVNEVDFDNLYDTAAEVESYFGTPLAKEFGFTFDDDSVSAEEMIQTVARCAFCSAYRQGSVIRVSFERATEASVLLFNHRNLLPRTMKRGLRFGVTDDHDGIELAYIDPKDGAGLTYDIPTTRVATSPQKLEQPGVRSDKLAAWHAWRDWNKLQYQYVTLEAEATQEAALVIPTDRIRVTDQTRPPGFEGEVEDADGLDLMLSQPTQFAEGVAHIIFLQHVDATVEALPVGPWVPPEGEDEDEYRVTLGAAPRLPLAADPLLSARAGYEIVAATDGRSRAYLVTEREPNSDFTETLRAINYSPMYYICDELRLWYAFEDPSFRDQSAWDHDGVAAGTAGFVTDPTRGKVVYEGGDGTASVAPFELVALPSYAKGLWFRSDEGLAGEFLSSADEHFSIAAGAITASHAGGAAVGAVPEDGEWHHALVSYDGAAQLLTLYVDGVVSDVQADTPRGALSALTAFSGLVGRTDDLRYWKRALTDAEALSLFRATNKSVTVTLLGLESGGGSLLLENGGRITLE